jgi:hypothetical protein
MAHTALLLQVREEGLVERRPLTLREEDALASASDELVAFAIRPPAGAIALERDGEIVAAWTRKGALRLAELLAPAHEALAATILDGYRQTR